MIASPIWDVVIVGAGLAGASTAAVLSRKGVRVVLIDTREVYPACFKAEKIEPDQAELLRKFGLMEGLLPYASRIHEVVSAQGGQLLRVLRLEQYGIFYQDLVNGVRAQLRSSVTWKLGRVRDVVPGPDVSHVTLMGGETIAARLVVLACGTGSNLHDSLGLRKRMIGRQHSFAIGFNIVPVDDGELFPFQALTYYPDKCSARVGYLTLFPIRNVMRANLFVYRSPGEEWVYRFARDPEAILVQSLPKLVQLTGPFRITSRIEMSPIDLYRVEGHLRPGLALLGDAYQSVCPTTGMGVSKVLTDVDVLCECIPDWLVTSGMNVEKITRYYDHPRKVAIDAKAIQRALYTRTLSTDASFRWRIYRRLKYFGIRMYGWADLQAHRRLGGK